MFISQKEVSTVICCDFIEKFLLPVLVPFNGSNPHSIVVIDSASIHHVDKVVQLCWWPAVAPSLYSLNLNPIEPVVVCQNTVPTT